MKKQEKQLKELYFKGSLYALAVDDFIHETVGERTAGILRLWGTECKNRCWKVVTAEKLKGNMAVYLRKLKDEIRSVIDDFIGFILRVKPQDFSPEFLDELGRGWVLYDKLLVYLAEENLQKAASEAVMHLLDCCNEIMPDEDVILSVHRLIGALQTSGAVPVVLAASEPEPEDDPYLQFVRSLNSDNLPN